MAQRPRQNMKQLKSSLSDLRRLFARTITLRDIAEPLVSFDHGQSAEEVCAFLCKREFDVVGVREHGVVIGYVIREELKDGIVGAYYHSFGIGEVLSDSEPLLAAFSALREHRHAFINVLGHVGGIITRDDLQKAPVRLWLFGLVSLLEMQMLRLVRERYPGDLWISLLTEPRVAMARSIFDKRRERNEANDLSDCLQIVDKAKILLKDDALFKLTGFSSRQAAETLFNKLGTLRDALAHANDILNGQWPELMDLVTSLETTLERFEKAVVPPKSKS
jgi:hypothetical protein